MARSHRALLPRQGSSFARFSYPRAAGRPRTRGLPIEVLERRLLLANLTVDTLQDVVANDRYTSLREAISMAASLDTITFAKGLAGTILLGSQLEILNKNLTITGPGASRLAISGDYSCRVFYISGSTVTLQKLTIADGSTTGSGGGIYSGGPGMAINDCVFRDNFASTYGGGLYNHKGTVTLDGCTFSRNSSLNGGGIYTQSRLTLTNSTFTENWATNQGGGIYNDAFGNLTLTGTTLSNNSAASGGGIYSDHGATLTNCTLSGNTVTYSGAGIYQNAGTLTLTNSTLSSNHASYDGGGIELWDGSATLTGCTFSGNSATGNGGGLFSYGTVTLTNSTFGGNTSTYSGGAIFTALALTLTNCTLSGNAVTGPSAGGGAICIEYGRATLYNSIASGNFRAGAGRVASDIVGSVSADPASSHNLVGVGYGFTDGVNGNIVGVNDPRLAPLASDGGPTQTMALLHASPALNAGDNGLVPGDVLYDQRGSGYPRIYGTSVDMGAYEAQSPLNTAPTAGVTLDKHNPYGSEVLTATVSASDPDGDAITFTYTWKVNGTVVKTTSGTTALSDTLDLSQPGRGDPGDTVTVEVVPTDSLGLAGMMASDTALVRGGLVVTTLLDTMDPADGLTSLREAIASADAGEAVSFDPALAGGTIVLGGTELQITRNLTIDGLGADQLTISGNQASRIFYIVGGTIRLQGLTIANGYSSTSGGGIYNHGTLLLTNCTLSYNVAPSGGGIYNCRDATLIDSTLNGNDATVSGGGIFNDEVATLTLTRTTVDRNDASDNMWAGDGAGIYNHSIAILTDCTLSGNYTRGSGGALYNTHTVTLTGCTLNYNTAVYGDGGGVYNTAAVTLTNCTLTGNHGSYGGGIYNAGQYSSIALTSSTISDNRGDSGAGLSILSGSVTLHNSIVSGNHHDDASPDDISGSVAAGSSYNLIGGGAGGLVAGVNGNLVGVTDPKLRSLRDNGGPTQTMSLLPGSPAWNAGGNSRVPAGLLYDQRGAGYPRIYGGTVDIGAFEAQGPLNTAPVASVALSKHNPYGGEILVANVTVSDAEGDGITFTYTWKVNGIVVQTTTTNLDDDQFNLALPGHGDAGDTITVEVVPTDSLSLAGATASDSTPVMAGGLVVTTLLDETDSANGLVSLREAIASANTGETVSFDPALAGGTIVLNGNELAAWDKDLTVQGLGADQLTLSGNHASAVLAFGEGVFSLVGLTIADGSSRYWGGAIRNSGTLTLSNCMLRDNFSERDGGAIENGGHLTLNDCTLSSNSTGSLASYGGGAIHTIYGTVTLNHCTLQGNNSADSGGAIFNDESTVTLTGCTLTGNTAIGTGAISTIFGTLTLTDCTLSSNCSAGTSAGGISTLDSSLTLTNCTFSENSGTANGGALCNSLSRNRTVAIAGCTFSGNSAQNGGAIYNEFRNYGTMDPYAPVFTVTNCTFKGNSAIGSGGGIYHRLVDYSGTGVASGLTVNNCTVSCNLAGSGGGIYNDNGTVTLRNSIVSGNQLAEAPDDVQGSALDPASPHNLIGIGGGLLYGVNGNIIGVTDPRLGPLADNGGPTWTMALLPDSPALDAGDDGLIPAGMLYDQRGAGYPRIDGGIVDIGAYELNLNPAVSSTAISDGAAQRSMVRKLTVVFSEPVNLAGGAVTVKLSSGLAVPDTTINITNPSADQRTYVLSFSGAAVVAGSLADGIYDLAISAAGIQDLAGNAMVADYAQRFHRLFGDADGNKVVNALDYAKLKATYGRSSTDALFNSALDYESNSIINALDLAQFRKRYGQLLSY